MTDFGKGKMFHRLSPDDRRAGEHAVRAGEKDDYTPVIPVPKDAPAPDWNKLRPKEAIGDPVGTWRYHTAENELASYVARWEPKDPNGRKKKVIRPATWNGTEFFFGALAGRQYLREIAVKFGPEATLDGRQHDPVDQAADDLGRLGLDRGLVERLGDAFHLVTVDLTQLRMQAQ